MRIFFFVIITILLCGNDLSLGQRHTIVTIKGNRFFINGKPTLQGCCWRGQTLEGLLPNSRMVQGIFDDLNADTRQLWNYPDSGKWSAERNNREFLLAMKSWRDHGLLAFTINIQGGSPYGYSKDQPWINPGFTPDGQPDVAYFKRLEKILDHADELGMVVILGIFYFGQDQYLKDEKAMINAVDQTINWIYQKKYTNLLIEVTNESDHRRNDHSIIRPEHVHELILRIQSAHKDGWRLPVSTSFCGGVIPTAEVVRYSDFILLHGNGVHNADGITAMVDSVRRMNDYTPKPIVFNEDDHFNFDQPRNNFFAATCSYASWGYFDFRMDNEKFEDGFQSIPVDWTINSTRKKAFFTLLDSITRKENCKK